ncbi:MFS transporter [Asticcacaulis benevestitus]|nr:MFS transporter [Asticcacaulis benevestitus]
MTVLDTNIVAVILPSVARDLNASFADIEWVVSSYVLTFASLLLPAGAIADRFGRRRIFLVGIGVFAMASLLCGWAPSAAMLYGARALQGAGAAFLLAPALAVIGHAFHEERLRNRAWAIWGGIMGLTMVVAPLLGGLIAFALGWRWAFFINLPICLLLAGAVFRWIDESRDADARALDPWGMVLFSTAMFGFTFGLINGQAHGWFGLLTLMGFAGGVTAAGCFVYAESVQSRPMLDLKLFRIRRFVGAVLAMFAYASCAQVMTSLLPLYMQNGVGYTPLQAGVSMLPFGVAMLVLPQIGRRLERFFTAEQVLVGGLLLVSGGDAILAWGVHVASIWLTFGGMIVLGSGGGLLNGETQKAVMSAVPRDRAGMASGISTTSRFSGILLGFTVLSTVLAASIHGAVAESGRLSGFADAVASGDLPSALIDLNAQAGELATAYAHTAYSNGFATVMLMAAGMASLSALIIHILMGHSGTD